MSLNELKDVRECIKGFYVVMAMFVMFSLWMYFSTLRLGGYFAEMWRNPIVNMDDLEKRVIELEKSR